MKRVYVLLLVFVAVESFAKELELAPIFEVAGYRLGAYPYEHEEERCYSIKKLKEPYHQCDSVETRYSGGRLFGFKLTGKDFKGDGAKEAKGIMNDLSRRYPFLEFKVTDKRGFRPVCWKASGKLIFVIVESSPLKLWASFERCYLPYGREFFDPFPLPRKTKPITSMFGVRIGTPYSEIIDKWIDGDEQFFIPTKKGVGEMGFNPPKPFLDFTKFGVQFNMLWIGNVGYPDRLVVSRIVSQRETTENWKDSASKVQRVVNLFRKKYGIWFTWDSPSSASYHGCGTDGTCIWVTPSCVSLEYRELPYKEYVHGEKDTAVSKDRVAPKKRARTEKEIEKDALDVL